MLWLTILLGVALLWAGVDAVLNLGPVKYLTKRELAEAVFGEGAPALSEYGEHYARTRLIVQGSSLAILIALLFIIAGLLLVIGGSWLVLHT